MVFRHEKSAVCGQSLDHSFFQIHYGRSPVSTNISFAIIDFLGS